jgi:hypothetical protein
MRQHGSLSSELADNAAMDASRIRPHLFARTCRAPESTLSWPRHMHNRPDVPAALRYRLEFHANLMAPKGGIARRKVKSDEAETPLMERKLPVVN